MSTTEPTDEMVEAAARSIAKESGHGNGLGLCWRQHIREARAALRAALSVAPPAPDEDEREALTPTQTPDNGECGVYSADSAGHCMFPPHVEGYHSWEQDPAIQVVAVVLAAIAYTGVEAEDWDTWNESLNDEEREIYLNHARPIVGAVRANPFGPESSTSRRTPAPDVDTAALIAEAEHELSEAASAATPNQARRILAGEAADSRLSLIARLVAALRRTSPPEEDDRD